MICVRCGIELKNRYNLRRHFGRKKKCEAKYRDYSIEFLIEKLNVEEYDGLCLKVKNQCECPNCSKCFSTKGNMMRHLENCKKDKTKTTICNIINNNITINNIQINNIGNEKLDKINYSNLYFINKDEYKYFCDKAENHLVNYSSILNNICEEPSNKNYKIINKREKKFIVKFNDEERITYLDNIQSYYNKLVKKTYHNHIQKEKIEHYDEFIIKIDDEIRNFEIGNKTPTSKQYYKLFQKIKNMISEKIILSGEENKKIFFI